MSRILRNVISCFFVLTVVLTAAAAEAAPRFEDYAVSEIYRGKSKRPDLTSPDAYAYRTRLNKAAKGKVNFAGHYIVTTWGCGTTCVTGAVIDALTGAVTFLPFTACCWGAVDDAFEPVAVRTNSRLIVFSGLRNEEEPMGAHYYEFADGKFHFLQTIDSTRDFRSIDPGG